MEFEPSWRRNISDICRDFYSLSKKHQRKSPTEYEEILIDNRNQNILTVDDAIRIQKSKNGNKQLAWQSFKFHSSTNIEAKYWFGHYYYHDKEIPELQQIDKKERIRTAVEIFKETADKGNPSAQLRYGICLWQGEGVKALNYLKSAAGSGNSAAMYIIGKAYWNGGNGIEKDERQGAEYLKSSALNNHPKAKEMCVKNNIPYL